MSQNVSELSYHTRKRIPKIIKGILSGQTQDQIAEDCHVTRRTIVRDLKAWRKSGGMHDWVADELLRLHGKILDEDLATAYREISKTFRKMLKQQIETEVKGDVKVQMEGADEITRLLEAFQDVIKNVSQGNFSQRTTQEDDSTE